MAKVIGIDLGTTFSCVAVMERGQPVVIPNPEGGRTTPSVVALGKERLVGTLAKRQAVINPEKTVYSIKRFMGRRYQRSRRGREARSVQRGRRRERRRLGGGATASVFSARNLGDDSRRSSRSRPRPTWARRSTKAVITVPAYFNDSQRQATKDAGQIAGLERDANHQRADRSRAGLRAGQEEDRDGSPSTTSAAARSTFRSWKSATACSR